MPASQADDVLEFVRERLPEAAVETDDAVVGQLAWRVSEAPSLARLFATMEDAKQAFGFADYGVTQASLEQVFVDFARSQVEVDAREESFRRLRELRADAIDRRRNLDANSAGVGMF